MQDLVKTIKDQWEGLWENTEFTDVEILAAWGITAAERFRIAAII